MSMSGSKGGSMGSLARRPTMGQQGQVFGQGYGPAQGWMQGQQNPWQGPQQQWPGMWGQGQRGQMGGLFGGQGQRGQMGGQAGFPQMADPLPAGVRPFNGPMVNSQVQPILMADPRPPTAPPQLRMMADPRPQMNPQALGPQKFNGPMVNSRGLF